WIRVGAALVASACKSVLATMNSTPSRPVRTMRLTALPPPPPTPMTLMRAPSRRASSSFSRIGSMRAPASLSWWSVRVSSNIDPLRSLLSCRCRPLRERLPQEVVEHAPQADEGAREGAARSAAGLLRVVPVRVHHEAHGRRALGRVDVIHQAAGAGRRAAPDREIEDLLGDLGHPLEVGAAAGEHEAGVERAIAAGVADLVPEEMEDLLGARLQDLGEHAARHQPRLAAAD